MSDIEERIKAHVEKYDTPKADDPRRRYTVAQLETAIRLAATDAQSKLAEAENMLRAVGENINKLPSDCLGFAYADETYIPRVGSGRVDAILEAKTVSVRDELLARLSTTLATIREEEPLPAKQGE